MWEILMPNISAFLSDIKCTPLILKSREILIPLYLSASRNRLNITCDFYSYYVRSLTPYIFVLLDTFEVRVRFFALNLSWWSQRSNIPPIWKLSHLGRQVFLGKFSRCCNHPSDSIFGYSLWFLQCFTWKVSVLCGLCTARIGPLCYLSCWNMDVFTSVSCSL